MMTRRQKWKIHNTDKNDGNTYGTYDNVNENGNTYGNTEETYANTNDNDTETHVDHQTIGPIRVNLMTSQECAVGIHTQMPTLQQIRQTQ